MKPLLYASSILLFTVLMGCESDTSQTSAQRAETVEITFPQLDTTLTVSVDPLENITFMDGKPVTRDSVLLSLPIEVNGEPERIYLFADPETGEPTEALGFSQGNALSQSSDLILWQVFYRATGGGSIFKRKQPNDAPPAETKSM
jgi:hypothetical protein